MIFVSKRIDDRGRALRGQDRPKRADALASGVDKDRVEAAIGHPARDLHLYAALVVLSFVGVPTLASTVLATAPGVLGWTIIVAIITGILLLAFTLVRSARKHLNPRAWVSLGLCANCAYRIPAIEPEADGCRVCPECGCAWKLDDSVEGSASRPSRPSR